MFDLPFNMDKRDYTIQDGLRAFCLTERVDENFYRSSLNQGIRQNLTGTWMRLKGIVRVGAHQIAMQNLQIQARRLGLILRLCGKRVPQV